MDEKSKNPRDLGELDMDEISDRIGLLQESLDELDQAKVFPLQFKITLTTYLDFRGELLALIGGHINAKNTSIDTIKQLKGKENEVNQIAKEVYSMCEAYQAENAGEDIMEHYNKEVERTDKKFSITKLFSKKSSTADSNT